MGFATASSALLAGLAVLASGQDSVHFERRLKVGDTASYRLHFSGSAPFGDLEVTQTTSDKIIEIEKDGNADVWYTVRSRKVLVNGSEFPTRLDPPFTRKVDKNGVPVDGAKQDFDRNDFSRYLDVLFGHDVKVGQVLSINRLMPDGKGRATGSLKLVGVHGGEATLEANLTVPRGAGEPTLLKGEFLVSTKDAILDKVDAKVENLDLGQTVLTEATYSNERVHS